MSSTFSCDAKRLCTTNPRLTGIREQLVWRHLNTACWCISALLPILGFCWLVYDGYSDRTLAGTWLDVMKVKAREPLAESISTTRMVWIQIGIGTASVSILVNLLGFLFGSDHERGLKRLLGFLGIAVAWLVVGTQWDRIHYLGRSLAVSAETRASILFAEQIDRDWAVVLKGESESCELRLDHFNAYPMYKPTLLMFLSDQSIPNSRLSFRAIERDENVAVRFELSGENLGFWLECRFDRSPPTEFIGGLGEEYRLGRYKKLAERLFLVDYR